MKTRAILIVLILFGACIVWADWDATKPADNRDYDLRDDDCRANFAAIESGLGSSFADGDLNIDDVDANEVDCNDIRALVTPWVDVTHSTYGATGNGTTDDYTAINTARAAATSAGSVLMIPAGTYFIGTSITFTTDVILLGTLEPDFGATITFAGPESIIMPRPRAQIFDEGSGGNFAFTNDGWVYCEWWGGAGDDSTDCTTALQNALDTTGHVRLLGGTYQFDSLDWPNNASIVGVSRSDTVLKYTGTGVALTPTNAATNICHMRDFTLQDSGTGTIGIDMKYTNYSCVERLYITGFTTGLRMYNDCYHNIVRNCYFTSHTTGVQIGATGITEPCNRNTVEYCQFQGYSTNTGIVVQGGAIMNLLLANDFESDGATGIDLTLGYDTLIWGDWFEVGAGGTMISITNGCLYTDIRPGSHAGGTGVLTDSDQYYSSVIQNQRQGWNQWGRQRKNYVVSTAYNANITPDAKAGDIIDVGALTGNTAIAAATGAYNGQHLTFHFVQDGTGGRTVTWNAVYLTDFQAKSTASAHSSVTFMNLDGTYWIEVGRYNAN